MSDTVFQHIRQSFRHGDPHKIRLERFEEVLHDTTAGRTYPALSGIRKQSVEDVERLFSPSLILWMENKGYHHEAACATNGQRSELNAGLLNYILDAMAYRGWLRRFRSEPVSNLYIISTV